MSPEAIQSLIDMFGVEHGVQILNLFTAPGDTDKTKQPHQHQSIKERPKELLQDAAISPHIPT